MDQEILSQIIQGSTSARLRRKALRDNLTLKQLLDEARGLELLETRSTFIEGQSQVNTVRTVDSVKTGKRDNSVKR